MKALKTRQDVLTEIDRLLAKAQTLSPEDKTLHVSFLEFSRSVFQPECVGIRLRAVDRKDGTARVVCIWGERGVLSDVEVCGVQPDQLRWLIRRVAMTGLFVGAFAADRRKTQDCIDRAGVDACVRVLPPKYGSGKAFLAINNSVQVL